MLDPMLGSRWRQMFSHKRTIWKSSCQNIPAGLPNGHISQYPPLPSLCKERFGDGEEWCLGLKENNIPGEKHLRRCTEIVNEVTCVQFLGWMLAELQNTQVWSGDATKVMHTESSWESNVISWSMGHTRTWTLCLLLGWRILKMATEWPVPSGLERTVVKCNQEEDEATVLPSQVQLDVTWYYGGSYTFSIVDRIPATISLDSYTTF